MKQTARSKTCRTLTTAILSIIAAGTPLQALASLNTYSSTRVIRQEQRHHPDGLVGQIAARAGYLYAAAARQENRSVTDWQRYRFTATWVALGKVSFAIVSEIDKQDSVRYGLLGGLRYYFANPLSASGGINPDGKTGIPVITVLAGADFSGTSNSRSLAKAEFDIALPLSSRLTLSGNYRYFEKIEPFEVSRLSLAATFYSSSYTSDSAYVNPDGPLGYPILKLVSGGSENGLFGELSVILPIKTTLTLQSTFRFERTGDPYQRSLAAGFEFAIYPHRR